MDSPPQSPFKKNSHLVLFERSFLLHFSSARRHLVCHKMLQHTRDVHTCELIETASVILQSSTEADSNRLQPAEHSIKHSIEPSIQHSTNHSIDRPCQATSDRSIHGKKILKTVTSATACHTAATSASASALPSPLPHHTTRPQNDH